MKVFIAGLLMLASVCCATEPLQAQTTRPAPNPVDHAVFDRILQANVRNERVDYLNIRRRSAAELRGYLDQLARIDVDALSRDEQLTFYINLYNATMIDAVVHRYRVGYSTADNDFAVFKAPLVRLKDRAISLNDLENKIIRPTFKDPRIHAALVCGARSCPPLPPRAFRADDLEQILEARMRRFVNDASRNQLFPSVGGPRLSRIFDWFAADFGGRGVVRKYVSRYAGADLAPGKIEFLDYSWLLNIAPPRDGKWVSVTDGAKLRAVPDAGKVVGAAKIGEVFRVIGRDSGWTRIERSFGAEEAWLPSESVAPLRIADG